jgi:hypothetical protein
MYRGSRTSTTILLQGHASNRRDQPERIDESGSTNYYQTVPKEALDTILWLESDRMGHFSAR